MLADDIVICSESREQVEDSWQKDNSKSEKESLQDGSETCYDVWFEDVLVTKRQEAELVVELKMLRK